MTIKEMIKKVNTYNEVAEIAGTDKMILQLETGAGYHCNILNYKSFKNWIRELYVPCVAEQVLNCATYEFDTYTELRCTDSLGSTFVEYVTPQLKAFW
jgi:hypothetical protein